MLTCLLVAILALSVTSPSQAQTTERLSVSPTGVQGNHHSSTPKISPSGRYVAFDSRASNLVPGDTNDGYDVFVLDRQEGRTERVSVSSSGFQGNGWSYFPRISADGRFVAFLSRASNLVQGDTNGNTDIFVHDRQTGETTRVSEASNGSQANGSSYGCLVSADGRFVAFSSGASNLVPGDTNNLDDAFVHDRQTGETNRVSVSSAGEETVRSPPSSTSSNVTSISADGRFVAFNSFASNLVPEDTNDRGDVFVHNHQTGETTRVSVSSQGEEASGGGGKLTENGRFVFFNSSADNLVANDTNGFTDIFVHDRLTGDTTRVNVSGEGEEPNGHSSVYSTSSDGRFVAFASLASIPSRNLRFLIWQ